MDLYDEVCRLLHLGHGKGKSAEATCYRCFRKRIRNRVGNIRVPRAERERVKVKQERWATSSLVPLLDRETDLTVPSAKDSPLFRPERINIPVIVAHFRKQYYLIDGNRRVMRRYRQGLETTDVYVVTYL